jgi:hypothetical protein
MSTQRQIEANRLNAQASTGPRTPEGKAVSSQNALKSGLDADSQFVYGEDRNDLITLQHEYEARFQPATPEERFQLDTMLRSEWILRRLFRAEAHLWEYYTLRASRSDGVPLGEALANNTNAFTRLQRRVTLTERAYKEAFAELQRLQATRRASEARPEPQQNTNETPKLGSFLNFSPECVADAPPESHSSPKEPQLTHA